MSAENLKIVASCFTAAQLAASAQSGNSDSRAMLLLASAMLYLRHKRKNSSRRQRKMWVREIFRNRGERGEYPTLINELRTVDDENFFVYFRMTRERFDHLLSLVGPAIQKKNTFFREAISPEERLSLTLRYLAHGDSQRMLSLNYRMGKSTISGIISETCHAIWDVLQPLYMQVPNEEKWVKIAEDFQAIWNFPNCIGAIDGKHVVIQAPDNSGSEFFNYKGTHSVVLLGACDANYVFTIVDIGAQGRQSDGGIFTKSSFGQALLSGQLSLPGRKSLPGTTLEIPPVFVADSAFPLMENIFRPYPGKNLTVEKAVFNYRLSRARRIIENTFGILVSKWRIFRAPIIAGLNTVDGIVKATTVLHNYLRITDINETNASRQYCPARYPDYEDANGFLHSGRWRNEISADVAIQDLRSVGSNMHSQRSGQLRDAVAKYFCSKTGEVPWQYNVVNRGFLV